MDPNLFTQALGRKADDAAVQQLLRAVGASAGPKLNPGEVKARVAVPDAGLFFMFTDEAMFRKAHRQAIGAGPLLLTNVTFYCRAASGYSRYTDALPFDLQCSDCRAAVRTKLGEPQLVNDDLQLDRWTKQEIWLFVFYADDWGSIRRTGVQLPDPT